MHRATVLREIKGILFKKERIRAPTQANLDSDESHNFMTKQWKQITNTKAIVQQNIELSYPFEPNTYYEIHHLIAQAERYFTDEQLNDLKYILGFFKYMLLDVISFFQNGDHERHDENMADINEFIRFFILKEMVTISEIQNNIVYSEWQLIQQLTYSTRSEIDHWYDYEEAVRIIDNDRFRTELEQRNKHHTKRNNFAQNPKIGRLVNDHYIDYSTETYDNLLVKKSNETINILIGEITMSFTNLNLDTEHKRDVVKIFIREFNYYIETICPNIRKILKVTRYEAPYNELRFNYACIRILSTLRNLLLNRDFSYNTRYSISHVLNRIGLELEYWTTYNSLTAALQLPITHKHARQPYRPNRTNSTYKRYNNLMKKTKRKIKNDGLGFNEDVESNEAVGSSEAVGSNEAVGSSLPKLSLHDISFFSKKNPHKYRPHGILAAAAAATAATAAAATAAASLGAESPIHTMSTLLNQSKLPHDAHESKEEMSDLSELNQYKLQELHRKDLITPLLMQSSHDSIPKVASKAAVLAASPQAARFATSHASIPAASPKAALLKAASPKAASPKAALFATSLALPAKAAIPYSERYTRKSTLPNSRKSPRSGISKSPERRNLTRQRSRTRSPSPSPSRSQTRRRSPQR